MQANVRVSRARGILVLPLVFLRWTRPRIDQCDNSHMCVGIRMRARVFALRSQSIETWENKFMSLGKHVIMVGYADMDPLSGLESHPVLSCDD